MSIQRDELHRLVDELPEGELNAVLRFLQFICAVGSDLARQDDERASE